MGTAKQSQNRKKFTREYKVKEIQRSITKKTRLRKEYLKALKDEGYTVPEKEPRTGVKDSVRKIKEARATEGKKKLDEKKEIKKQRKKLQRDELNERRNDELERIRVSKEKFQMREDRKKRMTQRTRSGQPLMGPKIEDLLDKIKTDDTYTS
ncbi:hypothetical protein SEUBUCD646_0L01340 [Saccharomyces eubayanus]|uniref:rRNA-processing protein FYV7 n=2 Tax=Saccharomyces TaxID=4930 RepID=A0A6C1EC05_SACPS|nr:FYV7-like protein [Saccharomyces eubayanus]KOG97780.1 FYV7-like protein [Saccharomyces eubayanus]QID86665.1 rRNA-processing protein fyv7 [Saccharomyces pastorianus]CAI1573364.1 hypothetical protein SEUBUCD650_0L01320 [Saccharomyces eubayanus]CAI1597372.1 hypothetical protein SEUBUCD646_0L01340 [Saccharomyces eubayanus]